MTLELLQNRLRVVSSRLLRNAALRTVPSSVNFFSTFPPNPGILPMLDRQHCRLPYT